MKRLLIGLALAVFVGAPVAAHAQDEWTDQVRSLLQTGGRTFEQNGYEMTHHIYTGSLDEGEDDMLSLDLDVGKIYKIMAACDQDCSDVDLVLYDGNGNEVDSDLQADDFPIVSADVSHSGEFRLKVKMITCKAEPCRFGIGVFGK